ncbi:phenolic acid decarboxylase [Erwinia persicina]|uniref:Phenolic acid decarboxylase n=2 Tax=Erwinia persicina TaxID=55211 RepID=A0ABR8ZNQ0_9GAMM|nr:phenolic acid decarboxylase [Erwinia persicina]MBC3944119.1 phenolic acid decarboxylase [Erwinia persicina]MBD8105145.1 phenolic acid decarboxylase [Erwinia persicina]MBD8208291.1 phenolic acid decarboxylase [Erwinia persicina]MCQ4092386.1 phenolic acid decarboxylase [Erwinia persicina]MCQ4099561.1 phenolic acid decarboxylase [Erwinia persicina]
MMTRFNQHDLSQFVGKHLVYTYDNGWDYEIYVKNAHTVDYRIHSGMVGNRWVKDQQAFIVRIAAAVYKISWHEPTGTSVSLVVNLSDKIFHGTIFFPRWVMNNPQQTVCFQNDHIAQMEAYRDAGPVWPVEVIDEFATLTLIRDCGENNEEVINCAASELPADFPAGL